MFGIKRRNKALASAARSVRVEGLESRQLLAGVQAGDFLYFVNTDAGHGAELWKSDLDGSNPAMVKDIRPGIWDSDPMELFAFNGTLFFSAINGSPGLGRELYKSDGTEAGTQLVKDIYQYGMSSKPHGFMVVNNHLLFLAAWSGVVDQLYVTDGTTAGTVKLFGPTFPVVMKNLQIGGDGLLHWDSQDDAANKDLPWVSDGTSAGTDRVYGQIESGILHVQGTGQSDQISISSAAGTTSVTVNGQIETFDEGGFNGILVEGLTGADRIDLSNGPNKPATIHGGSGDDTLIGGAADDVLNPGIGADSMLGGAGNDTADYSHLTTPFDMAGEGDHWSSLSTLLTGSGDDVLSINSGDVDGIQSIDAGPGNDRITFFRHSPGATVHGGDGNDDIMIYRYGGSAVYYGDAGNDILRVYRSSNTSREFFGGTGTDTLDYSPFDYPTARSVITLDDQWGDGNNAEQSGYSDNAHSDLEIVIGTWGHDYIVGTSANNTILGGNANDTIIGNGGSDVIEGSLAPTATFRLSGGLLSIIGSSESDTIVVRPVADNPSRIEARVGVRSKTFAVSEVTSLFVDSGDGDDRIQLDAINLTSRVYSRSGNDTIIGGSNADRVYGGEGNDWIGGGFHNDTLYGEGGNDRIFGGAGRDYVDGGAGADLLRGEGDQDRIVAKAGEDDFRGNIGDILTLLV